MKKKLYDKFLKIPVDTETHEALKKLKTEKSINPSEFVRQAIKKHLKKGVKI